MLKKIVFFILVFGALLTQGSFAAVSLSVNPIDGSNTLRFDRTTSSRMGDQQEVHIRVTSTNGDRYQVFQNVLEPMMDEKGNTLNLQAIGTQTLSNSNSAGTLYLQNADHLSMSDQLVYSSSQSGESDMFTIGYSLNQNLINSSGIFRGRLVFTVRGVGNNSSAQATLDVFLETTASGLNVSIKGGHNATRLRVQSSDISEKLADFVNISFSGNSGEEIRIYQEVETYPENETDEDLGADVLQLDPQGGAEGLRMQGLEPLKNTRTLIYSSDKNEDNFVVYFLVNTDQVEQQGAGMYNGKIKYTVETNQGRQEFPIGIECNIPPVFSVNVSATGGGVSFTHVLANTPPQDKEVLVTVTSNLHKPYQVIQNLQTNMTNQQGKEFDSKYFTNQVEIPPGQRGQTNLTEFSPVLVGDNTVFSSDGRGDGAIFKVVYRLQGYDQMNPGDFSAPIRFSLNQK